MAISVAKMALWVLSFAACFVYAMNLSTQPMIVGGVIVFTVLLASFPITEKSPRAVPITMAFLIAALGLALVWVSHPNREEHASRVLGDLGWAQALVGAWLAYSTTASGFTRRSPRIPFDDEMRKRWREGDMRFGVELARRIVIRAQPSWAALVVETAWPEPRPETVTELLQNASNAKNEMIATWVLQLKDKTGVGETSEARWELARIACEVIRDAQASEDHNDVGGPAVARFVVAAAGTVRDDDDAKRIFAALVLPAVARRA